MKWIMAYLALLFVMSPITLVAYGWDKWRARREGRRISERTLHTLALLGGWPGALAGQRWFRHKTRKYQFQFAFWGTLFLHFALLILIAACALWWAG